MHSTPIFSWLTKLTVLYIYFYNETQFDRAVEFVEFGMNLQHEQLLSILQCVQILKYLPTHSITYAHLLMCNYTEEGAIVWLLMRRPLTISKQYLQLREHARLTPAGVIVITIMWGCGVRYACMHRLASCWRVSATYNCDNFCYVRFHPSSVLLDRRTCVYNRISTCLIVLNQGLIFTFRRWMHIRPHWAQMDRWKRAKEYNELISGLMWNRLIDRGRCIDYVIHKFSIHLTGQLKHLGKCVYK